MPIKSVLYRLSGPWLCHESKWPRRHAGVLLVHGQTWCRVPAENAQHGLQIRWHPVQHDAPAPIGVGAVGSGQADNGPQAHEVAVLHPGEIDVNLALSAGEPLQPADQSAMGGLVDLTSDRQAGRTPGGDDPERSVVYQIRFRARSATSRSPLASACRSWLDGREIRVPLGAVIRLPRLARALERRRRGLEQQVDHSIDVRSRRDFPCGKVRLHPP